MKCIQTMMKFVNRNAYVYIAMTGQSFFNSAASATALLLKNAAKTVAVSVVGDIALIFTKVIVVAFNCALAYIVLTFSGRDLFPYLEYPSLTIGLVGVETFLIASVFFAYYITYIEIMKWLLTHYSCLVWKIWTKMMEALKDHT